MTANSLSHDELGAQLQHPNGDHATMVGDLMFASNAKMIFKTIDLMRISSRDKVVEIGFGNGQHVPYLLSRAEGLEYQGFEISEAMIAQAQTNNITLVESGIANFSSSDNSSMLSEMKQYFNSCFSINSIYFWDDPLEYLHQIHGSLKPNAELAITFIEKDFGQKLPFTQQGFQFFTENEVERLMKQSSFRKIQMDRFIDQTVSKDGQKLDRPYWVARALK
ncbi:MAG: class I SAM-dependent methyltransferase [Sphingobacterium sp.]